MTTPDYRAALAEIREFLDHATDPFNAAERAGEAVEMLGALLAAPEAVGVADEAWQEFIQELQGLQGRAMAEGIGPRCDMVEWAQMLGTAHPAPVPVGERLPWVGDCDAEGRCWYYRIDCGEWHLSRLTTQQYTHWLPHWALPLPGDQP